MNTTTTHTINPNNRCWAETTDGNRDDPTYFYCDLPANHAGDHNYRYDGK